MHKSCDEVSETIDDSIGVKWTPKDPDSWALYLKTKNFAHLMAAFCAELRPMRHWKGDLATLPMPLMLAISEHFQTALNAETEDEAQAVLGVKGVKPGGFAQRGTAKNQLRKAKAMKLLDSMEHGLFKIEKASDRYEEAAKLTGYKAASLKTLSSTLRPKKKR